MKIGCLGLLSILLVAVLMGACGCGNAGDRGTTTEEPGGRAQLTPEERELFKEAQYGIFDLISKSRNELGLFVEGSTLPQYLEEKAEDYLLILEEFSDTLPEPPGEFACWDDLRPEIKERVEGTIVEALLKVPDSHVEASLISEAYLKSLLYLYDLKDFQEFIVGHTIENGSRPNPENPPPYLLETGVCTYNPGRETGTAFIGMPDIEPVTIITLGLYADTGLLEYGVHGGYQAPMTTMSAGIVQRQYIIEAEHWLMIGNHKLIEASD